MYYILVALQVIGMLIGVFQIAYVVKQPQSKCQMYLLCMMAAAFINSLGYLFEMRANSMELAIQALKFIYFGKAFGPFLFMLFMLEYCKIELPTIVKRILLSVHIIILLLVETCEYNNIYYSSIGYSMDGFFPHLVLGHTWLYNVYTALLICYFIIAPIICIVKVGRDKDKNKHHTVISLTVMLVIVATGLLAFLLGLTNGYDTTAFSYVIAETIMLSILVNDNILETLVLAKDYVADNLAQGLVILDNSNNLLYSNESAKAVYPALQTNDCEPVIDEIIELYKSGRFLISHDNVYKVTKRNVVRRNSNICDIYVMEDFTNEYYYADRLQNDVRTKTAEISMMQRSIVISFAGMVEARDGDTGQHVKRTSGYVSILTRALMNKPEYRDFLDDETVQMIIDAAPLHDIGKIAVPDAILTKPGKLTKEEFDTIKKHTTIGAEIIEDTLKAVEQEKYLNIAIDMAHYHHEKWDGSGYPEHISGRDIPLAARIMAVADVYDALRSKRSYKEPFTKERSYEIIMEGRGQHFDPDIIDVFVQCREEIEKISME